MFTNQTHAVVQSSAKLVPTWHRHLFDGYQCWAQLGLIGMMCWKTARTYSEEFLQEILQRVGMEMLRWKDLMETFQGSHSPGSTYRQYGQVIGPTSNKHPTKSSSCQTHKMQGAKGRLEAPHASSSKMSGELVPFFFNIIYYSLQDCG